MKYVILGSSATGLNAIREIRDHDQEGDITLVTKDTEIYSRCILHKFLAGERSVPELSFVEDDFIERYKVNLIPGTAAEKMDVKKKEILLSNGETISYDKVLIATGSSPINPPVKNLDVAKNVIGFRNLEDAEELKASLPKANNIVIMGGGLVAIDVLSGLVEQGVDNVHLIEMQDRILPIQLDKRSAKTYEDEFEKRGVTFHLGALASEVEMDEDGNISAVILNDGTKIVCDYLVVAAGVRANIQFLDDVEIERTRRGIVIDDRGHTSIEDVYGGGDVTGFGPIWPVAVKNGIVAGANMAGQDLKMTDFYTSKSTMNYFGIPTMSLGFQAPVDETYTVEIKDDGTNYMKIAHKDGKIEQAIVQGDLSYVGILLQLIKDEIDISKVKKPIFKIDYSDFFKTTDDYEYTF